MKVIFCLSFKRDIEKIKDEKLKLKILDKIIEFEKCFSLTELNHINKIKGHPTAYRLRIGDYRIGFYYEDSEIKLVRFVKRNDIYKLFP